MNTKKDKATITFECPREFKETLQKHADREDIKVSQLIRRTLRKAFSLGAAKATAG